MGNLGQYTYVQVCVYMSMAVPGCYWRSLQGDSILSADMLFKMLRVSFGYFLLLVAAT